MPKYPTGKPLDTSLPPDVIESDLKYPSKGYVETLTFHQTQGFGWCIATLHIRKARRAGQTDRTYAIRVSDGAPVRIGLGPHVTQTVYVYVTEKRLPKLQKYIDLLQKGQIDANTIRDRISSRRAEGAVRRAQGQRSWRWSI